MVKRMEKRSARILAFILALIMVGSVLAYAFRNPSKPEERKIEFDMGEDWRDWLKYLPNGTGYVVFYNFTEENETLRRFMYNSTTELINPYVFRDFRPTFAFFSKMLIYDGNNYLIDVNKMKVYFAYQQKDRYKNFTFKTTSSAGRLYTLIDEIHPVVLAYPNYAKGVVDVITNESVGLDYTNYTDRLNGSFSYAIMFLGSLAMQTVQSNGTPMADFYFEGYRMNNTTFEKVVGIHFLGNYFFVKTNETANKTEYYYYKNYDDGFSVAVMGCDNLTNLTSINPEIRSLVIRFENIENLMPENESVS
jgi:hypothetical protein